MTTTENYGLKKPEANDIYGDFVPGIFAENMDKISAAFGGMKLRKLTQTEYDALSVKDPDTLYTVTDGSKVTQYLGETELKSGSVTAGIASIAAVGTSESAQGEITQ